MIKPAVFVAALLVALALAPLAALAQEIPDRPAGAETGSAFIARTASLSRPAREAEIQRAFLAGNFPDFLRWGWVEVTVTATGPDMRPHTGSYWVMSDYLAIGSDADFVRMPMGSLTAQRIADAFGCSLPTRRMVDQVWRAASVKLSPIPLTAGPQMMSNAYFLTHQRRVEAARAGRPLGALTAGHKKDVVLSNLLRQRPGRVAIYGWHYLSGKPIQPLSTVHENAYADYSHGIRLVWGYMYADGRVTSVADVLKHSVLHRLLSDEGAMPSPRIPGV